MQQKMRNDSKEKDYAAAVVLEVFVDTCAFRCCEDYCKWHESKLTTVLYRQFSGRPVQTYMCWSCMPVKICQLWIGFEVIGPKAHKELTELKMSRKKTKKKNNCKSSFPLDLYSFLYELVIVLRHCLITS